MCYGPPAYWLASTEFSSTTKSDTGFTVQMTPNSSIHILAKSDENVPANSQTGVLNDWVDLKEKPAEEAINPTKERLPTAQANKVQHEVAALKMAQGLLKGELDCNYGLKACALKAGGTVQATLEKNAYPCSQCMHRLQLLSKISS